MRNPLTRATFGLAACLLSWLPGTTVAQEIDLSGLAYVDYYYTFSSPDEGREGLHGFTYRRLYLTSDFTLDEDFFGRARLEANASSTRPPGPTPFVKDLWVAWRYTGEHDVRIGVMPPPVFELPEEVWGYRSLEQTILDFQDVNESRDFGIRLNGPLAENVQYAVMVANNEGVQPELDAYKRLYGLIEFHPTERLSFSLGADRAGYAAPREGGTRISGFGGYRSDRLNFGVEAYWYGETFETGEDFRNVGSSLFARYAVAPEWELVGRLDAASKGFESADAGEYFVLVGSSYAPADGVKLIPNLWWRGGDLFDDPELLGRFTLEVSF